MKHDFPLRREGGPPTRATSEMEPRSADRDARYSASYMGRGGCHRATRSETDRQGPSFPSLPFFQDL